MNATKTAVNRAFAIIAVMALMLCSFAAIFATESEAAEYSSLENTGTAIDQEFTLDISTGQSFAYQNITTNLDGYGSISYQWTGTAADETGTNGIKLDTSGDKPSLSGVFTSDGTKQGVLTATWTSPDSTGVTQTATQTFNFNVSEAIEITNTVTGYAQVGSDSDDTTMTITFTGGGNNIQMTGGTQSGVPFAATLSGNTITVKPTKLIAEEDVSDDAYQLNLTVTNGNTNDSDSVEVNIYVYDDIAITNNTTHFYTYEGDVASSIIVSGIDVTINYETDSNENTSVTDKTVVFSPSSGNVISGDLSENNHMDVDVSTGFVDAGDLTGDANSMDYTAKVTVNGSIPSSTGGTGPTTSTATVNFIVTVYKSLQFTSAPAVSDITVTNVGTNSNTVLLSSYISGANSVVFEWGDGFSTAPMTNAEVSANYTANHTYAAPGTYLVTIYATNDQGTTTSKVMYSVGPEDAGTGTDEPEQPAEGDGEGEQSFFDEHGYLFIVFIVLAAVCVFAYVGPFHIQHPLVIIAAVICAILAILTFVYVDVGGIADAIGDLFNSEE